MHQSRQGIIYIDNDLLFQLSRKPPDISRITFLDWVIPISTKKNNSVKAILGIFHDDRRRPVDDIYWKFPPKMDLWAQKNIFYYIFLENIDLKKIIYMDPKFRNWLNNFNNFKHIFIGGQSCPTLENCTHETT